jgi:hypothetical protein
MKFSPSSGKPMLVELFSVGGRATKANPASIKKKG